MELFCRGHIPRNNTRKNPVPRFHERILVGIFLPRTSYTILRRRALLSRFSCRPPRKSNQHNNSSFRRRRQPVHHNSIRFGSVSCYACMLIISWRSSLFRGCGAVIVIRWFALISFHYADI
jgi:hypothetical protein